MTLAARNHPDRYALANELHSRPFPVLEAPCRGVHIALQKPDAGAGADPQPFRDHLLALLDRHGAQHPAPDARHWSGRIGRALLKWEMHAEFVTYSAFDDGISDHPFDGQLFELFPDDWLAGSPGVLVTSAIVRVEIVLPDRLEDFVGERLTQWFVPESLAVSSVLDGAAVIASDFRIDGNGHTRFAVLSSQSTPRRLGRIVQRILEIETYKTMSMLALPVAHDVSTRVSAVEQSLSEIVAAMAAGGGEEAATLDRLLRISAEIEALSSRSAFRFGATGAYAAIVAQRVEILRETRIFGKQLFSEFMARRYEPAMRTCRTAGQRLRDLSARAERASNLLRTRVDVAVSNQNNELLKRMEQRAALQLRLQETVEGLSVVAVSYYGVNLATYLLAPLAEPLGLKKAFLSAFLVPPVVLAVWLMIRRIRRRIEAPKG